MAIPDGTAQSLRAKDIKLKVSDLEFITLRFGEAAPVSKLLFTLTPTENFSLRMIRAAFGPITGAPAGFAQVAISKQNDLSLFSTADAQGQIIYNGFCTGQGVSDVVHFGQGSSKLSDRKGEPEFWPDNVYLQRGIPFFVLLATNFAAGTTVGGVINIYGVSTFA